MTPSKDKGTKWETAVVSYLAGRGFRARRKPPSGRFDKADLEIEDVPGIVIEAKNHAPAKDGSEKKGLAEWVDEAVEEAANAGVPVGVVWHHRNRAGSPGGGYVTMRGDHFATMLEELKALREKVKCMQADAEWEKWHRAPED